MDMNLLISFIVLNILNVIIQTIKSIITIKGDKYIAAITNAVAFGLYTVVVVYMVCDLPLGLKASIIAIVNLFGVFLVKLVEEKTRKDKIWKLEVAIPNDRLNPKSLEIENSNVEVVLPEKIRHIAHTSIPINNGSTLFNFFCYTQDETAILIKILDEYEATYFCTVLKDI